MLNDMLLRVFVTVSGAAYDTKQRLESEEGATTTEYIMILGIMALIVAAIFLSDNGIRTAIRNLGTQVIETITDASTA